MAARGMVSFWLSTTCASADAMAAHWAHQLRSLANSVTTPVLWFVGPVLWLRLSGLSAVRASGLLLVASFHEEPEYLAFRNRLGARLDVFMVAVYLAISVASLMLPGAQGIMDTISTDPLQSMPYVAFAGESKAKAKSGMMGPG